MACDHSIGDFLILRLLFSNFLIGIYDYRNRAEPSGAVGQVFYQNVLLFGVFRIFLLHQNGVKLGKVLACTM